jgi:hypothetical protein
MATKCAYCGVEYDRIERYLVTGGQYSPTAPICEKCWDERKRKVGIWKNR